MLEAVANPSVQTKTCPVSAAIGRCEAREMEGIKIIQRPVVSRYDHEEFSTTQLVDVQYRTVPFLRPFRTANYTTPCH